MHNMKSYKKHFLNLKKKVTTENTSRWTMNYFVKLFSIHAEHRSERKIVLYLQYKYRLVYIIISVTKKKTPNSNSCM